MRNPLLAAALLAFTCGSATLSGCMSPLQQAMNSPLGRATAREDRDEIFSLLAKEEVRSADPKGRELVIAVLERRKSDALRLIESGADVNAAIIKTPAQIYDGYTPFLLAAWLEDKDLMKALAAKGADVNVKCEFGALTAVSFTKKKDMIGFLMDLGVTVDESDLALYVGQGNTDMARFLISRGVDVEKTRLVIENNIRVLSTWAPAHLIDKERSALQLLERLSQSPAAPQTAAAGNVTKDELKQMMKEAAAETARQAPAAAAPAVVSYKSDVDQPAYKVSENPDAYALVIGVEKYNTLPEARFAERDAKAMNAHLLAMGYPQRNIVLLTGSQATKTGLVKNLEAWLPNNVTERSTVMFYFSGHGAPDAKSSQAYLVPMDGDPQYLEETAYPIKRLYAKLAALKAKRVVVALDSCFSGAGGRSVLATGTRPLVAKMDLAPGEGKVVSLSASSSDEITGALEEQGHGLFTYQLLKALTETAGRGTVSEVYAALKPRVQDEARRQNRAQTPQVFGRSLDGGLR